MTYVIGFQQPGLNAIISDARITKKANGQFVGRNESLKTGLLFNGGIFGRLGSDFASRQFILEYKRLVTGTDLPAVEYWLKFVEFAKNYPYSQEIDQEFRILISERSSGIPEFHLLTSKDGLVQQKNDGNYNLFTYGSGKGMLDDYVKENFEKRLWEIQEYLSEQRLPEENNRELLSLYPFCLWLSELSLSFESSVLESTFAVGGPFHFVFQTPFDEHAQAPSIYVISSADRKEKAIYSWVTRLVYGQGCLLVDIHNPVEKKVEKVALCDTASRPGISDLREDELQKLFDLILKSQPYYYFCGFGFAHPEERKGFLLTFSPTGKREEIFDSNGQFLSRWQSFIEENFNRSEIK